MRAGNPKKYEGLEMSDYTKWLLDNEPKLFKQYCNGVGSKSNWFNTFLWHLTPNTIWFLNITPASDLHDVGWSFPSIFNTKEDALKYKSVEDMRFLVNVIKLIERKYNKDNVFSICLRTMRQRRAILYAEALARWGEKAFLEGKIILDKLEN